MFKTLFVSAYDNFKEMSIFGHVQLENEKYFEKHNITKFASNDSLNYMHFSFYR